jgi:2-dehydropantoate 2-reductase
MPFFRDEIGGGIFSRAWECASREVVLCLHGVESNAEWFGELAEKLSRKMDLFAFDRPGWGRSEGERGHLASYADLVRLLDQTATKLRERYEKVHLAGLSWGGLLALYVCLRRAPLFDSLTLIAPGVVPKIDLPLSGKLSAATGIVTGNRLKKIPLAIQPHHFTARLDKLDFIRNDPHRTREVSASFCLETLKMRRFVAEKIGTRRLPPMLLLLAGNDAIVDNEKTVALLAPGKPEVVNFSGAEHSLVFEKPAGVADAICHHAAQSTNPIAEKKIISVIGAGAVGSMVGGLLALSGHEVTLLSREKHAEAINRDGLRLQLGGGERVIRQRLRAVTSSVELKKETGVAVLSVKSFDTPAALNDLRACVNPQTVILSLQNGLGNEPLISEAFPENVVIAGAICAYLEFISPGQVKWSDDAGGVAGAVFNGEKEHAGKIWHEIFSSCFLENRFYDFANAAASVKWSKLMLNAAFNALNAATGLSAPEILAHPEYGLLAASALKEGFATMRALGVKPVDLPGYPVTLLAKAARLPASMLRKILALKTAGEKTGASSMKQDRDRGKSVTEIADLNGAILAGAESLGLSAPANRRLCELMQA